MVTVILRKNDGSRSDSFFTVSPTQILQLGNGEVWYGDKSDYRFTAYQGLRKRQGVNQSEVYFPEGPVTATAFAVTANNGDMWLAHGSKNESWEGWATGPISLIFQEINGAT